jgi:glutathione S-transferase
MIKLYGFPQTRANRVRWLLEELGAPYEFVTVEVTKGAHKAPEYVESRHAHGRVPALEDGPLKMIESSAMVLYLTEKFPDKKLAPPVGTPERGLYFQWIVYAAATVDEPVISTLFHTVVYPPEKRKADVVERHKPTCETAVRFVEASLDGKSYLTGSDFTAADVAMGYVMNIADNLGMTADAPRTKAWLERLRARPAFKKVYG